MLDDRTKKSGKQRALDALENPKGAVKDLLPGEKGKKERGEREEAGDQVEIQGERSGV